MKARSKFEYDMKLINEKLNLEKQLEKKIDLKKYKWFSAKEIREIEEAKARLEAEREERKRIIAYRKTLTAEEKKEMDRERNKRYYKEYYKKNKERLSKASATRAKNNPDKIKQYQENHKKKIWWKPFVKLTEEEKKQRAKERYIRDRDVGVLREKRKKRYQKNKDKAMANNKRYIEKHPEKLKEWRNRYNEKHKEEIRARRRELYYKNREKINARARELRQKKKENKN